MKRTLLRFLFVFLGVCAAGVVLAVGAVAAFYLEEGARGAAAWKKVQDQVTAQGISLNRDDYIPRVPPPDQNFGALPIFRIERDLKADWQPSYKVPRLDEALEPIVNHLALGEKTADSLALLPRWYLGHDDLSQLGLRLARVYTRLHPGQAAMSDPLALVAQLCPALAQFRAENEKRPLCVFLQDYSVVPITRMSEQPSLDLLHLTRVLDYEARVALDEKRPDLALADLEVVRKLVTGLQHEPGTLPEILALALTQMQMPLIQQGLTDHQWSDSHLVRLEHAFASLDFLKSAHTSIPSAIAIFDLPAVDYYERHNWLSDQDFKVMSNNVLSEDKPGLLAKLGFYLTPKDGSTSITPPMCGTACWSSFHSLMRRLTRWRPIANVLSPARLRT